MPALAHARPIGRPVRAATRNAVLWSASFGGGSFLLMGASVLAGAAPAGIGLVDALGMAVRFAFWGGICGAVFSAAVSLRYHGRRLSQIPVLPFALGTALGIGLFVPLALQTLNVISGDGLVPWRLVLDDGLLTGVLSGIIGGVTLKLAQLADRTQPPEPQ